MEPTEEPAPHKASNSIGAWTEDWDRDGEVYTHNGTPLCRKERWNTALCDNMDGPGEYHAQ